MSKKLKNTLFALGIFAFSEVFLAACLVDRSVTVATTGPEVHADVKYDDTYFDSPEDALAYSQTGNNKHLNDFGTNRDDIPDPTVNYFMNIDGVDVPVVRKRNGRFVPKSASSKQSTLESLDNTVTEGGDGGH